MIEQDGFTDYFHSIIIQTRFLKTKSLIKTYSKYSEDIVSMGTNNCSVIDDLFFFERLGEVQQSQGTMQYFDSRI